MGKSGRIWLTVAAFLVIIGLGLFAAAMSQSDWDFTQLGTTEYQRNTYEIREEFHRIRINTNTADITFAASQDGNCKVECYEGEKERHLVAVEEGVLVIRLMDERNWYDYIGIYSETPKIKVFLPKAEYEQLLVKEDTGDVVVPKDLQFRDVYITLSTGDVQFSADSGTVQLETSTGDIFVEHITAQALDLSTTTGAIKVSNVRCAGDVCANVSTGKVDMAFMECGNLVSTGSTGEISLSNVIAVEGLSIHRSTGDVRFADCDASQVLIETDTGYVMGSLLTDKVFSVTTDTGRVDIPKTINGGLCEVTTSTGDIKITID